MLRYDCIGPSDLLSQMKPSAISTITAILGNIDITGDRPETRGSLPQALAVAIK